MDTCIVIRASYIIISNYHQLFIQALHLYLEYQKWIKLIIIFNKIHDHIVQQLPLIYVHARTYIISSNQKIKIVTAF